MEDQKRAQERERREELSVHIMRFMQKDLEKAQPDKLKGEVGSLLREESIGSFFRRMREDIEDSYTSEDAPSIVQEAEKAAQSRELQRELEGIDAWQKDFTKWLTEESPMARFERDLQNRECSQATINGFMSVARRYMYFCNWNPEFTKEEVDRYLASLDNLSAGSRGFHRTALKAMWEALALHWPYKNRPIHHREERKEAPHHSTEQIERIIQRVKAKGTPRDKYLMCLATCYAPRKMELAGMTAKNFIWQNGEGTLTFQPLKNGKIRLHRIPACLTPYLKDYSQEASPIPETTMSDLYHEIMGRIGVEIKSHDRKNPKRDYRGKVTMGKGLSWHGFRHTLDTALHEAGVDEPTLDCWFGWRTVPSMARYYYSQKPSDADEKILARHPFISLWAMPGAEEATTEAEE